METAPERFQRILNENNLTAQLVSPKIREIVNGGLIIDAPTLLVTFTDPKKEEKHEPTTAEMVKETQTT